MTNNKKKKSPPWIIRTYAGFGGAEETNKRYRENLKKGQTGLSVAFDLPTQNGYDPEAPMARGEVGGCGVSIAHIGDMETLFDDTDPSEINTSMTINATAPFILALYLALAEKRGIHWDALRGTVQNDLLKEFVARGTSVFDPSTSLRLSTDIITFTAQHVPHWNPINVCGYHYTESGARPQEEIGYAFANAMIILDSIRPKLTPSLFEKVVHRISFFINSGIELIPEICKMRAYSRLWTDICDEEYGVKNVQFRAGCQVRSLSLTPTQPENNIVRIALEALPVILSANARINALQLPGFREALFLPDEMEQTLSLRTQQILMHETKITDYPDIFDGNPVISELTSKMIDDARALASSLRLAGYETTITSINKDLTKAMIERQCRIDSGEEIVVGVNEHLAPVGLSEQLASPPSTAQDPRFEEERVRSLSKWRQERDQPQWETAKDRLKEAASKGTNIMEPSIEFALACGTVGEWTSIIEQSTSGRYSVPLDLQSIGHSHSRVKSPKKTKIVLGKAGLDGHSNAIKILAIACRNAGMEVVFSGIKLSPLALIKTSVEEGADILGVSCLSGAHISIAKEILALRTKLEASGLKFIIGGTIPKQDEQILQRMGVDLVVSTQQATIDEIVGHIIALTSE
jgi:(2R)-ethylmalonyl-CoA mutase